MVFIRKPEPTKSPTASTMPRPRASSKEVDTEGSSILLCESGELSSLRTKI